MKLLFFIIIQNSGKVNGFSASFPYFRISSAGDFFTPFRRANPSYGCVFLLFFKVDFEYAKRREKPIQNALLPTLDISLKNR
jgi:hypothetical protein